jgi:hypothetical protein
MITHIQVILGVRTKQNKDRLLSEIVVYLKNILLVYLLVFQ